MDRSEKPLPAWRATETPYSTSVGDPLPGAESLLDRLATDRGSLTLHVSATRASARCPFCFPYLRGLDSSTYLKGLSATGA